MNSARHYKVVFQLSYLFSLILVCGNMHSSTRYGNPNEKIYIIPGWPAGFFSNFIGVLNHLLWTERSNKIPVIYWGRTFLYYDLTAPNGNAWEYYFQPSSDFVYHAGDTSDLIYYDGTPAPTYWSPDGYQLPYNHPMMFEQELRNECHAIITKYIRLKPHISTKVEDFQNKYMLSQTTIGVHLRGTDKHTEVGKINPQFIFDEANKVAKKIGAKCQFFVATDEERLLTLAKQKLHGKVIHTNATRAESVNGQSLTQALNSGATFSSISKNNLIIGEEVLIDALLLSKCDAFIHTLSLVSQAVSYFNPQLQCYLIIPKTHITTDSKIPYPLDYDFDNVLF